MAPPTIPTEQRFAEKYRVNEATGCWIWTASLRTNGYSQFRISNGRRGKNGYGHRFAYEHFVGPIPDAHEIDHLCRNRACVNPEHLQAVPHRENIHRSPTHNASKTHCARGHPLEGENVWREEGGRRHCRACWIERRGGKAT